MGIRVNFTNRFSIICAIAAGLALASPASAENVEKQVADFEKSAPDRIKALQASLPPECQAKFGEHADRPDSKSTAVASLPECAGHTTKLVAKSGKPSAGKAAKKADKAAEKNEGPKLHGIWVSLGPTTVRKTDPGGDFDGISINGTFGVDRWITPKILIGATVGFEDTDIDIGYNNGDVDSLGRTL